VPLGCALTVFALIGATRAMRSNDHVRTNIMFRRRIYAQGFTILAIVAGSSYWKGDREKRKEFEELDKERKRVEKREKWLAELENRDREDREFKESLGRRMGRRRGDVMESAPDAPSSGSVRSEVERARAAAAREGGDPRAEAMEDGPKKGKRGGAIVGSVRDL
jgi:hypothetical protein